MDYCQYTYTCTRIANMSIRMYILPRSRYYVGRGPTGPGLPEIDFTYLPAMLLHVAP